MKPSTGVAIEFPKLHTPRYLCDAKNMGWKMKHAWLRYREDFSSVETMLAENVGALLRAG